MAHASDFSKDEDQIVLDLINYDNETNLTLEEISLGVPVQDNGNVKVLVSPIQGSGYKDTLDIFYTRLDIQQFMDIFFPDGLTLQQGDANTIADLLPEINTALGTAIPVSSITDAAIGQWEGNANETKSLQLMISAASRVYQGSATFTLDGNDIPMDQAVSNKMLSGLNMPVKENQTPGVEYTSYTKSANSAGTPINITALAMDFGNMARVPITADNLKFTVDGGAPQSATPGQGGVGTFVIPGDATTFAIHNGTGHYVDISAFDDDQQMIPFPVEAIDSFQTTGQPILNFFKSADFVRVPNTLPASTVNLMNAFVGASSFNQDISGWDVSNVWMFDTMFQAAAAFNQPLNNWDVSKAISMNSMFVEATSFNQPLGDWDVSNVDSMMSMFARASSFNQNLNGWNLKPSVVATDYDLDATSWEDSNKPF